MLGHLIKKEVLEHLMSLRFAIACVLCLIVILCSLFVRCRDYGQSLDDYHQESAAEKQKIERTRRPWHMVWGGVTVHRKPNPLKVFVRGMDDAYGGAVRVMSQDPVRPVVRGMQNTSVLLFPSMDLIAFVGMIMSLMAVVFGYDAVCGEKERGTLRLMLSYSVPRHTVLLSKWIGGYVTLIVPFLLTVVIGAVIVLVQKDIALDAGQWRRLAAIVGCALLYVAVMYTLAICVSAFTARAATSAMILLSLWVILVLAVPNLSPYVAQVIRPVAGTQQLDDARRTASEAMWNELVKERMAKYDKEHGFGKRWWESWKWGDPAQAKKANIRWRYHTECRREAHLRRMDEYEKIEQRYAGEMNAQTALSRWIGRTSPFTCFALAGTELAGAGLLGEGRFRRQTKAYQRKLCEYAHDEWLAFIDGMIDEKLRWGNRWPDYRVDPIPYFHYVRPAASEYGRIVAVDIGLLAGAVLVLFMLTYGAFLRYDVR